MRGKLVGGKTILSHSRWGGGLSTLLVNERVDSKTISKVFFFCDQSKGFVKRLFSSRKGRSIFNLFMKGRGFGDEGVHLHILWKGLRRRK